MRFSRNKLGAFLSVVLGMGGVLQAGEVVNVYSQRHYAVDEQINAMFTKATGIEVKVVSAQADQLIERLKSEGENSPADVFVTVDAGRLQRAKSEGLLQPWRSEVLEKATPEGLRDPDGAWYPYTVRSRVILRATDRVGADELKSYLDLADPKWEGRLLVTSSSSAYNQALLASIIASEGEAKALEWAKGVVRNMARAPQGGDRDQIKAVAAGLADVCLSNTYYFGLLRNSKDPAERAAASKLSIVFPEQDGRGAQSNVSGAGIVKHAKNVENAKKYIEFLVSPEVQKAVANGSFEFPVNFDTSLCPTHAEWGSFKADTVTFPKLGENYPAARRIFDEAGWK